MTRYYDAEAGSLSWDEASRLHDERGRVLVEFDLFGDGVKPRWRNYYFHAMDNYSGITWLVETAFPGQVLERGGWPTCRPERDSLGWNPVPRNNIWLGAIVRDQDDVNRLMPELLKLRDLVPVLYLKIDLPTGHPGITVNLSGLDWIVARGPVKWRIELRQWATAADVPMWGYPESGRRDFPREKLTAARGTEE